MRAALRASVAFAALAAFFVFAGAGALAHGDDGETLVVDDDLMCPHATYTSIQVAVNNAEPGDEILVCPGIYREQVKITIPLEIEGIDYKNEDAPIVMPPAALPNSTSLSSGNPIAAAIVADHAKSVEIEGLTVDWADGGPYANCAVPNLVGIYYRNTSGEAEHNAVRNVNLGPGLFGCQSGQGIFVQSKLPGKSIVELAKNTIHDYQKTGILANEAGTYINAYGNTISGFGVSPIIAQNGVQIGFGATGQLHKNSIINHAYGACISITNCSFTSSNVLVFAAANGVNISENVLGKSQVNIYFDADKGKVEKNTIFDTDVFDGIYVPGDYNRIYGNTINTSDEAAIWLDGTKNTVSWNVINEAAEGIHDSAGGNWIGYNAFYNVVQKRTPAPTSLTTAALAVPTEDVEETTLVGLPSLNVPTASPIDP